MAEAGPRGRGRGRGGFGGTKRPMSQMQSQDYDDFSGGFAKKRKILEDVYRFVVREDLMRVVIGKGGQNIKDIKKKAEEMGIDTKVSIYAQTSNGGPLMEGSVDRVMSIQSTIEGLKMALDDLVTQVQTHQNYKGAPRGRGGYRGGEQKNQKLELRLLVPAHCCSGIIGKQGSVIKKIKEETNSYIQVYTLAMPESEEHCVRIQNFEAEDLVTTAIKIFEAIAEIKGKSPIIMYDPLWFEYGTYGDTGSYIDTDWYQDALRSGAAKPITFRELRGSLQRQPPRQPEYEEPYEEPYAPHGDSYEDPFGQVYEEEESFYPPPAPRGHGPTRGMSRGAPRGGFGAPRGFAGRGRGGAPRGFQPRGGARGGPPRGAPRGGF